MMRRGVGFIVVAKPPGHAVSLCRPHVGGRRLPPKCSSTQKMALPNSCELSSAPNALFLTAAGSYAILRRLTKSESTTEALTRIAGAIEVNSGCRDPSNTSGRRSRRLAVRFVGALMDCSSGRSMPTRGTLYFGACWDSRLSWSAHWSGVNGQR